MGLTFSAIFDKLFSGKTERKILLLGLDGSGKTTTLYKLQLGEVVDTTPTIGFNVEEVAYRGVTFRAWDVGGQKKLRKLWRHYYDGADGLIFVVDSADVARMMDVREELHGMLEEAALARTKVLVLANKQDMKGAASPSAVSEAIAMPKLRSHEWYVQGCCAKTGDGLHEGLDWMVEALKRSDKERK